MEEKIDDLFENHYFRERMLNDNSFKVNQQ